MATTTMMTSTGSSTNTSSSPHHAESETSDNSDLMILTHNANNNNLTSSNATTGANVVTTAKSAAHQAFASTSGSANASQRNEQYTLADVYDDAAVIGSELEKIIANYGSDVLKDLMPKVINVLELLEHLTIKNEKENDELNELRSKINSLEMEKAQRINEREKFEKELEEIEEKWKQETMKLIGMVNKLKDDNKRLNESLAQTSSTLKQNDQLIIKQEELDYIREIKEENIKLKETIRFKDRELETKASETEALQAQVESLSSSIMNFRRKQILAQNQIEKMVKAKAELECTVTEKEHQLNLIKEKLHMRSLQEDDNVATSTIVDEMRQRRASELITSSSARQAQDLKNMLIIDSKDPNRPRFTLRELEKVLMEKNQLTVKLDQTKDELEYLRKQEALNCGEVQGPINKEPDEKLDPSIKQQPPSGIRRFLSSLLKPNREST